MFSPKLHLSFAIKYSKAFYTALYTVGGDDSLYVIDVCKDPFQLPAVATYCSLDYNSEYLTQSMMGY
jgi:hypothetical protein